MRLVSTAAIPAFATCTAVVYSGSPSMGLEVSASLAVLHESGYYHVLRVLDGEDEFGSVLVDLRGLGTTEQPYVGAWAWVYVDMCGCGLGVGAWVWCVACARRSSVRAVWGTRTSQ